MPARASSKIHPLGDAALLVVLGARVDTAVNTRAQALAAALRKRRGVREALAGYGSVTVHYDPDQVSYKALRDAVAGLQSHRPPPATPGRLHRIPVVYDGPDLEDAARTLGLGVEDVIRLHTEPVYRVFMVGFTPGLPYMGPLRPELRLPRRSVPRTHVPAGSVAIANLQTTIYPLPTPGGWNLLGRTSMKLFLPGSDPPTLLRTGDRVKFFQERR